ncbi:MAG: amidohydrolase [Phycisphaerales bacterium]
MNTQTPRLREAHAHIPMFGRELTQPSLATARSLEDCLGTLRQHAALLDGVDPSRSRWLLANGARVQSWPNRAWPTRQQLDEICGARPAAVMSFDHHSLAANSAALAAAGITDSTPDPEGGVIARDPRGVPTGVLLESAHWLVRSAVPELSESERETAACSALDHLGALGFWEVHDLMAPAWLGITLAALREGGRLRTRVQMFAQPAEFDVLLRTRSSWQSQDVRLAGLKLFADGTLNSRTAWTLDPFANPLDDLPCGAALLSEGQLEVEFRRCGALGVECAVHAIGDGAVRACLNAYEASRRACPLRIEHCELIHPDDVPRFARLGVTASVQPCHLLYDIEVLRREFPGVQARVLPLRSLIASGLKPGETLLFGSDVPIVRADPQDSIEAAVHRRRVTDGPAGGPSIVVGPDESIDEATAWACFNPSV